MYTPFFVYKALNLKTLWMNLNNIDMTNGQEVEEFYTVSSSRGATRKIFKEWIDNILILYHL